MKIDGMDTRAPRPRPRAIRLSPHKKTTSVSSNITLTPEIYDRYSCQGTFRVHGTMAVVPGVHVLNGRYGYVTTKAERRRAKNSQGVNLDTGAMKSARELISGIAINVSAVSPARAKGDGPAIFTGENYGIKYLVTEAISTAGPGFDVAHKDERKNSFLSLPRLIVTACSFYEQLHERLKGALQSNVTRSTGLYAFVPDLYCPGLYALAQKMSTLYNKKSYGQTVEVISRDAEKNNKKASEKMEDERGEKKRRKEGERADFGNVVVVVIFYDDEKT
ncbi:hypothetical protein DBV15_10841 [Temnothorax longispinosus]|uniref:Uncharacterized protein n=1 Tax=Temnothorax longispinosus TaxID=300112 RepID=A0A4S2KIT2_9HYME|nr:hypothetical protein DBV15_10841 [Temnothorax longispinosus]